MGGTLVQNEALFLVLFVLIGEGILPSGLHWLLYAWFDESCTEDQGRWVGVSLAVAQLSRYTCLVSHECTWICDMKPLICSAVISGESTVLGI